MPSLPFLATLSCLALLATAFAMPSAVADDTCVGGNAVCVIDRSYGSRPCPGQDEYSVSGVRVLGEVSVTHTERCSDTDAYHQEADVYRVDAGIARANLWIGNGSTDAYGDNELVWLDVMVGSFGTGAVFVDVYRYRNDVRDECYAEVDSTFTTGFYQVQCPVNP